MNNYKNNNLLCRPHQIYTLQLFTARCTYKLHNK